jgi:ATP/maltotriose-dependent transcriptional regulator MalT
MARGVDRCSSWCYRHRCASILTWFSAPLCHVVTARNDSAEMLSRIEHDQLFLIPLDNRREWYRYHHLFGDVLEKDPAISAGYTPPGASSSAATAIRKRMRGITQDVTDRPGIRVPG